MASGIQSNKRLREESIMSSYDEQPQSGEARPSTVPMQTQDGLDYPRRRAVVACEICRSRKSRCDGAKPKCRLCRELKAECVYREPGAKLDAGDKLILEQLARIEGLLQTKTVAGPASPAATNLLSPAASSVPDDPSNKRLQSSPQVDNNRLNGIGTWPSESITAIPKRHTAPALNLLQWPVIRDLVTRAYDPQALLEIETSRQPLKMQALPSPDMVNIDGYVTAFFERVNVWYACVNPYSWRSYYRVAALTSFNQGLESCLVHLVLALGAASKYGSIAEIPKGSLPGMDYFASAWALFPAVMFKNDMLAVKCHMLAAAYLFYLVRPLEAWNMLTNASSKLQLLLNAPDRLPPHAKELSERLYWNTLLVESDLLAELDLPHSGIVNLEEAVNLPGPFRDTGDEPAGKDELWYFLAEIALRRLLNRVTHLIYTKEPSQMSPSRLERVVSELDYQLGQWYEGLPGPVKFPLSRQPTVSAIQTVLRMRYFAGRTIIFRPYILTVLADEAAAQNPTVQENCRKCLEAAIRQIENPKEHQAGHLPYLWQGALSLISQTLIIMGASMSPALAALLPPASHVDSIIANVITELGRLARLAPSIRLGSEIIREAEDRRRVHFKTKHSHKTEHADASAKRL